MKAEIAFSIEQMRDNMKLKSILSFIVIVSAICISNSLSYSRGKVEGAKEVITELKQENDSLQSLYIEAKNMYLERCEVIATYDIYREAEMFRKESR